jgi:hypothetical protein
MPPRSGAAQRQATSKARVQGVTGNQTVKATAGYVYRVVLSNSGIAGTLTLIDGATTLIVLNVLASTMDAISLEIGAPFTTSIVVNPSATGIDVLVIYD